MSTASIKLYDILVEKGVDKLTAREAVGEFVTREEATNTLASKDDVIDLKAELLKLRADFYRALMFQAFAIIGAVTAIFAFFS